MHVRVDPVCSSAACARVVARAAWLAAVLCAVCLACAPLAVSAAPACHAVIVDGLPGTPWHAARFQDWATRFRAYLVERAGVPATNIVMLSGAPNTKSGDGRQVATAACVLSTISNVAARAGADGQFILFMAGHGENSDGDATFVLPGRDVRASELREALAAVSARNQVVIHCGASAGDALSRLAAADRVVVAADAPGEVAEPVFGEFFLLALERAPAGSLGAAYNLAARETAMWIRRIQETETGWRVDGRESVRIFRKLYGGGAATDGGRVLDPASQADAADAVVALGPPAAGAVPVSGQRVVTEHAILEDTGREAGVAAVTAAGHKPVAGAVEGEPGFRAGRVILGRPELQPVGAGGE